MALTQDQFRFIVEKRAIAVTPDQVVLDFARKFKPATCTLADVALAKRNMLPEPWQKVWDETLEEFNNAPTKSRDYRIGLLNEKLLAERDRGAKFEHLVEQIAKEMADAYAPKGATKGDAKDEKPADSSITWKIVDPDGVV